MPAATVSACDFVVFGGTGDLAMRKLLPALYLRDVDGQLPDAFRVIGVSRSGLGTAGYRGKVDAAAAAVPGGHDRASGGHGTHRPRRPLLASRRGVMTGKWCRAGDFIQPGTVSICPV